MARQFGSSFTLIDTGTQGVLGSGREEYRMPTVYARTLRRAAELLGGEGVLTARLGVTKKELDLWLRNFVRPPNDVFLKAADIVGEHELRVLNERRNVPRS